MNDCIFCKIINGEIPSYKVYEDADYLAFLDINPKGRGHTLVVPKRHNLDFFDISTEELSNLMIKTQEIAIKIKNTLKTAGIRIMINNGKESGQEIYHMHVHIIPSYINKIENTHDFEEIVKELSND